MLGPAPLTPELAEALRSGHGELALTHPASQRRRVHGFGHTGREFRGDGAQETEDARMTHHPCEHAECEKLDATLAFARLGSRNIGPELKQQLRNLDLDWTNLGAGAA